MMAASGQRLRLGAILVRQEIARLFSRLGSSFRERAVPSISWA
jgi:hypothetical protein